MTSDVIVIGAGVAGLECARQLNLAKRSVTVLDKGRGVGGRCATRRVNSQPVDHGVCFLHGSQPDFLEELDSIDEPKILGWPTRVRGSGQPCQADTFVDGERRLAFKNGLNVFPKHLAQGLDIKLQTKVTSLTFQDNKLLVASEDGQVFTSKNVIVALHIEQCAQLIAPLSSISKEIEASLRLLQMVGTMPCLSLIAQYPIESQEPDWDLYYPDDSKILLLLSHDSAKRDNPNSRVMVYQALPRFSRSYEFGEIEASNSVILNEAARLIGDWAASPTSIQTHRWRYSRTDRSTELAGPVLLQLSNDVRLGLAGELFFPGGGVEAAWSSGRTLARRFLSQEQSNVNA